MLHNSRQQRLETEELKTQNILTFRKEQMTLWILTTLGFCYGSHHPETQREKLWRQEAA